PARSPTACSRPPAMPQRELAGDLAAARRLHALPGGEAGGRGENTPEGHVLIDMPERTDHEDPLRAGLRAVAEAEDPEPAAAAGAPACWRRGRGRALWAAAWPKLAAVALALGLWELVVLSGWRPEYVLPGPGAVLGRLWADLLSGDI